MLEWKVTFDLAGHPIIVDLPNLVQGDDQSTKLIVSLQNNEGNLIDLTDYIITCIFKRQDESLSPSLLMGLDLETPTQAVLIISNWVTEIEGELLVTIQFKQNNIIKATGLVDAIVHYGNVPADPTINNTQLRALYDAIFLKEDKANKATEITEENKTSDIKYPTTKLLWELSKASFISGQDIPNEDYLKLLCIEATETIAYRGKIFEGKDQYVALITLTNDGSFKRSILAMYGEFDKKVSFFYGIYDEQLGTWDSENYYSLEELMQALTYNRVGLLNVSDYDEETGEITYIYNSNLVRLIDDTNLEETGEITIYANPIDWEEGAE